MKTQLEMVKEYLLNNYNKMTQYVDREDNSKYTLYEIIFETGHLDLDNLSIWLRLEDNKVGFEHNFTDYENEHFVASTNTNIDSNITFEKLYEYFMEDMCYVFNFDPEEDVNFNESHAKLEPLLLKEMEKIKKYILNETLKQELKTNTKTERKVSKI